MVHDVLGCRLPQSLSDRIDGGSWPPAQPNNGALSPPIEDAADLQWFGLPGMQRETEAVRQAAGAEGGFADPVDRVIVLACTYDQELVALDFATTPPRVVASDYRDDGGHWVAVAASFDELARTLGI
ncbi:MAG: hypothetical protein KTR31_30670 [Myxococcales bacterium]|nr:hypothetical protein [Myxococcales bacterium]